MDQQGAEGRRGDSLSPGSHPHPLSLESLAPGSSHSPAGVFLPGENWPVCGFYGPETAFSLQALSAEPRLPRPPPLAPRSSPFLHRLFVEVRTQKAPGTE